MSEHDRARRFTRLRPRTGDLFEHFGVGEASEPAVTDLLVRAATSCTACGWLRPIPLAEPCWLCGVPS